MPVKTKFPAPIYQRQEVTLTGATGPLGGPAGAPGASGPQAVTATGPRGPTGASPTGVTGPGGFTGPTGARGATGPTGGGAANVGPTGGWGDYGADGPTGPTGTIGHTGLQGPSPQPRGVTGGTGPTGTGNVSGLMCPLFADNETFLTMGAMAPGYAGNQIQYYSVGGLNLVPVFVPFARTYTEIVCESYQAMYPTVWMVLGIYDCDENGHPTTVVFDSGQILPIGQGRMGAFFSVDLQAKPYYLAFGASQAMYIRSFNVAQIQPCMGFLRYGPPYSVNTWQFEVSSLYYNGNFFGGLPDLTSVGIGAGIYDSTVSPLIGIR